jgi:7,8-dihydropterin-6-yl-methyl-4-(beta-D-ribofuranosyl)aminobenzene 5'-phosphate synthase
MEPKGRMRRRTFLKIGAGAVGGLALAGGGVSSYAFASGRAAAQSTWAAARYPKLEGIGKVKSLTIIPLVDYYPDHEGLVGEGGLAYLVRADGKSILLDVGYNQRQEHPSPLLRNAAALDADLDRIDALVISHPHNDHLGGTLGKVRPSAEHFGFRGIPAYLPAPLESPTTQNVLVDGPRAIAPGVATLGVIPSQDFFLGWTPEQSLAVDVEGKGLVLVVGCGHPTVERIVERAETLFDSPLHGVVGGLHFPVTASRSVSLGLPAQQVFGTGKWPWERIGQADVADAIAYLKERKPGLVALSAHDSCDWSLGAFREAFGGAYREVRVGREIVV